MTIRNRIDEELERLQGMIDDLDVQAALAKADASDELSEAWKSAQDARARLEAEFARIKEGAEGPIENIGDAAEMLIDEIKNGYKKIRELI